MWTCRTRQSYYNLIFLLVMEIPGEIKPVLVFSYPLTPEQERENQKARECVYDLESVNWKRNEDLKYAGEAIYSIFQNTPGADLSTLPAISSAFIFGYQQGGECVLDDTSQRIIHFYAEALILRDRAN